MYFVVSGVIDDTVGQDKLARGMGGVLSPANILSRTKQAYSTAVVSTDKASLRVVSLDLIFKLMVNPDFRHRIFSMSVFYFSRLYKDRSDFLGTL